MQRGDANLARKQYLGQRDNLDQRVNTEIQVRADLSKLDDAELAEYERLANKVYAQTIDVTPAALPAAPDEQVSTGDQTQEREGEPMLLASSGTTLPLVALSNCMRRRLFLPPSAPLL